MHRLIKKLWNGKTTNTAKPEESLLFSWVTNFPNG